MTDNALPVLHGIDRTGVAFRVRALEAGSDLPAVVTILSDPSVRRWWGDYDEARVRREYGGEDEETSALVIAVGSDIVGIIQFGEELDPDYRHASIDIALVASAQDRGIGPAAIRALARYLFDVRGHHRLTIDPAAENRNAIRAYERVGFRPVGIMRQYERGLDGAWHDGLLMEMLATELADPDVG